MVDFMSKFNGKVSQILLRQLSEFRVDPDRPTLDELLKPVHSDIIVFDSDKDELAKQFVDLVAYVFEPKKKIEDRRISLYAINKDLEDRFRKSAVFMLMLTEKDVKVSKARDEAINYFFGPKRSDNRTMIRYCNDFYHQDLMSFYRFADLAAWFVDYNTIRTKKMLAEKKVINERTKTANMLNTIVEIYNTLPVFEDSLCKDLSECFLEATVGATLKRDFIMMGVKTEKLSKIRQFSKDRREWIKQYLGEETSISQYFDILHGKMARRNERPPYEEIYEHNNLLTTWPH